MRSAPRSAPLLAALLSFGLVLPFLGKPVHVDDANFLALAQGARLDAWRPHAVPINWQGHLQPAFEVLSNPPGIGWLLAPVADAPVWAQHLSLLPWLALALWGAWRLGRELAGDGLGAVLVLGSSPVLVLAAQALTPDLPLAACVLGGLGGFVGLPRRWSWAFALLLGCAALFRYSGLALIPLIVLAGWQRGRLWDSLTSLVPISALVLHDLHAYGEVHLLAMGSFQSVSNTPRELLRKAIASVAMLGGAGLLPLAVGRRGIWGALAGAALGMAGVLLSGQSGLPALMTVACAASGGASLGLLRARTPQDRLLLAWGLGGLLFLLALRFSATRYWLPFLAAPALAILRQRPSRRLLGAMVGAQALLALLLSVDDLKLAQAQQAAALWVGPGPGSVAGHWGWQHHMEAQGWTPLEDDGVPLARLAVAEVPWPQEPDPSVCLTLERSAEFPDRWPGPRTHGALAGANLHAFLVHADPLVETYAPWGFSDEPYERVAVYARCGGADPGPGSDSP